MSKDKSPKLQTRRKALVQLGALSILPVLAGCEAVTNEPRVNWDPYVEFSRDFRSKELSNDLAKIGARMGDQLMLRVFKEESELEAWVKPQGEDKFKLFRVYPICYYSGELGPKVRVGDMQSPEGFYYARGEHVRAQSQYHRAIDFGFPNTYDRQNGYTGSLLLIHGNCISSGCYAMTDPLVDELYQLTRATTNVAGQGFWIHSYPFRMTDQRMARVAGHKWEGFWKQLKSGYDAFELTSVPPKVTVRDRHYIVEARTSAA